ncbi:HEPN domain protein [uncultured archaeon]|nr:HEPN domain protein [uncultured archaeon]
MISEKEVSAKWLERAEKDLAYARHSLEFGSFDWAQFVSQQAAEKALKAVCIAKGIGLFRVHDLQFLARKAGAPKEVIQGRGILNSFYTISRYPDAEAEIGGAVMGQAAADALNAAEG